MLDMRIQKATISTHPLAPEYLQYVTIIVSRKTTRYEWGTEGQSQIGRAQLTGTGHPVGGVIEGY